MVDMPTTPSRAQALLPWIALVIAAVALVIALVALFVRGDNLQAPTPPLPPFSSTLPSALSEPGRPPDLSTLTPRQAADRLFNRVMTASEAGDTAEALRFAPMGIQAYRNLGSLDNDARYHVALLHLTTGNVSGAREQIKLLRRSVPRHLLGYLLEHKMAERDGDTGAAAKARQAFLSAYDTEILAGRAEYRDHAGTIERFRAAVPTGTAGKK